jgi:hypothetical protein
MNRIARLAPDDRRVLFAAAADRRRMAPPVTEKDFWVCWLLQQLFGTPEFQGHLVLKGGTSLSKVFGVIERFSEDIDLIVDWDMLGFKGGRSPQRPGLSTSRRNRLLAEMLTACQQYIAGPFLARLRERVTGKLGAGAWQLAVDADDAHVVNFSYPASFPPGFLRPEVRLELGTHAEFIPQGQYEIRAYAAEEFPDQFQDAGCSVVSITAERTFWEKVTILHQEAYRAADNPLPDRTSRHYYDVAQLARSEHRARSLADLDLLKRVVEHKKRFYPRAWARYDWAKPGTMRLLPPAHWQGKLEADYRAMRDMIFGTYPPFGDILETLASLENDINHLEASDAQ